MQALFRLTSPLTVAACAVPLSSVRPAMGVSGSAGSAATSGVSSSPLYNQNAVTTSPIDQRSSSAFLSSSRSRFSTPTTTTTSSTSPLRTPLLSRAVSVPHGTTEFSSSASSASSAAAASTAAAAATSSASSVGHNPFAGLDPADSGRSNPAVLDTNDLDTLHWTHRYLPNTGTSRQAMLEVIGAPSVASLFEDIPEEVRLTERLDLPEPQTEGEILTAMTRLSGENLNASTTPFFVGGGLYHHSVPSMVDHIIQRSEWMTAYTPYQPEVAQGTLTAMFEFQTQVSMLTGLPIANASMYCGGTATGEAVLMAVRLGKGRKKAVVAGGLHPQYSGIIGTLSNASSRFTAEFHAPDLDASRTEELIASIDDDTACVVVQSPDVWGNVHDLRPIAEAAHAKGALLVSVTTEALSFGALATPGSQGADIATGEGQSIGVPLSMGGPTVGLLSCRKEFIRQMPGRIVGQTTDSKGDRSYVLTLGTREQHIRRDKATSNICTSAGLMALAFSAHLTLLGESGLEALAMANHANAAKLAAKIELEVPGARIVNETFFNEFTVELPQGNSAVDVVDRMVNEGVLAGVPYRRLFDVDQRDHDNMLVVACTEMVSDDDMIKFISALQNSLNDPWLK